jgi:hypothetical protein
LGEQLVARFIPADQLKKDFDVLGHFYSIEFAPKNIVDCRSVLEIVAKEIVADDSMTISERKPDAVFIMMNPGSSRPLVTVNNHVHAEAIYDLPISLVPTKPDTTQYQVMRLMHYCEWRHARILNLSDLRCSKSNAFFKQYKALEIDGFDSHSIFSKRRANELTSKLTRQKAAPVIRAWGLSSELDLLIDRCTAKLGRSRTIKGLLKEGMENKYLHPLPSLQSQKLLWIDRMVEQLLGRKDG